jgi:hypothetical protein
MIIPLLNHFAIRRLAEVTRATLYFYICKNLALNRSSTEGPFQDKNKSRIAQKSNMITV